MATAILEALRGPSEEELRFRRHVRREQLRQSEREVPAVPLGRLGKITPEDLAATQHRIRTGLPALPCACWRW